ncbi:MAG: outer membrane protein assembly factor BamE [Gammaproteobacteria bacterium]|jgi:outer membrane protein assembly factor BamE
MKLRQFFILTLLISIVSLSACVYRQDISQGNRINDEKLVQLEEGMTKAQVEFLLGTPAIIDIHHPDDWFYIHYLKIGNSSEINKRVMTLRFSEDLLMTIKGRDTF